MIYTLTLNPALDYVLDAPSIGYGVNRAKNGHYIAGGKGINVSAILTELGAENAALGFVGGFVGEKLRKMLLKSGINCDFIDIPSDTRINVKLRTENGEIEINAEGAEIPEAAMRALMTRLERLSHKDVLVMSGSAPKSLPPTVYADIMLRCRAAMCVDATGNLLLNTLQNRPFLVKPNNIELGEIYGDKTDTAEEVVAAAKRLCFDGARNVLVSRGGDGAILVCENGKAYRTDAPKGKPKNTVGAGDSMLAGFVCEYLKCGDFAEALRAGTAAGSASAFSDQLARAGEIAALKEKITVHEINC